MYHPTHRIMKGGITIKVFDYEGKEIERRILSAFPHRLFPYPVYITIITSYDQIATISFPLPMPYYHILCLTHYFPSFTAVDHQTLTYEHKFASVSYSVRQLEESLLFLQLPERESFLTYTCTVCSISDLSENQLVHHTDTIHEVEVDIYDVFCPICLKCPKEPYQKHMHFLHGKYPNSNPPRRAWDKCILIGISVIRRPSDGKFLIISEAGRRGYWVPGGGIDCGEDVLYGMHREVWEEAGIEVNLKGILNIAMVNKGSKVSPGKHILRTRIIFYAEPVNEAAPCKAITDYESSGAVWVGIDELSSLVWRDNLPLLWLPYVHNGGTIYPMDLLTFSFGSLPPSS